ncbi:plasmid mobilization protein [Ferrovibrio xuzhouensis]|uniref:Conjugal transfer protein TraJ n=1 Tax=Ferrovibrio xuzhouensis TaxID=1576914 RepID=A0ABV7VBT9_9PROT
MAATNRKLVKSYFMPAEHAELERLVLQTGLSASELVRRLFVGRGPLPSVENHQVVRDLMKINADLARLGNLLKLTLDDSDFNPPAGVDLQGLFQDVREAQQLLKAKIANL